MPECVALVLNPNRSGLTMDKPEERQSEQGEQPQRPASRRPWHAPRFIMTDVTQTDAVCNAGSDGPFLS